MLNSMSSSSFSSNLQSSKTSNLPEGWVTHTLNDIKMTFNEYLGFYILRTHTKKYTLNDKGEIVCGAHKLGSKKYCDRPALDGNYRCSLHGGYAKKRVKNMGTIYPITGE